MLATVKKILSEIKSYYYITKGMLSTITPVLGSRNLQSCYTLSSLSLLYIQFVRYLSGSTEKK